MNHEVLFFAAYFFSIRSPQFTYGFARITNIKGNTIHIKLDGRNAVSRYIRYSVEIPPENSKKIRRISSIFGIS